MEEKKNLYSHKIALSNRQGGSVTGVKDVSSFDEKEILLLTDFGKIILKGEKLHVSRLDLDKGEVDLSGRVDSLQYVQKGNLRQEESLWKRMFR